MRLVPMPHNVRRNTHLTFLRVKLAWTHPQPREAGIHFEDLVHEGVGRTTLWQMRELAGL